MRSKHGFVCINCPLSCELELIEKDGEILDVNGADCKIGEGYAAEEFKDPRRIVTTTVRVSGGMLPLLPVRTVDSIPKRLVPEVVRVLADVVMDAPIEEGQVVYPDILGTGVDVISSREML